MWLHYAMYGLDREGGAEAWGVPESWVRIRREDRLRQAVSLARAFETQQWKAGQKALREAEYDPALIARCETMIGSQEAAWDDYFARRGIRPLCVTYEALAGDYQATLGRVLDHLGHGDVAVPPPQLERQADERTEDWVSRYRRDRELRRGRPAVS